MAQNGASGNSWHSQFRRPIRPAPCPSLEAPKRDHTDWACYLFEQHITCAAGVSRWAMPMTLVTSRQSSSLHEMSATALHPGPGAQVYPDGAAAPPGGGLGQSATILPCLHPCSSTSYATAPLPTLCSWVRAGGWHGSPALPLSPSCGRSLCAGSNLQACQSGGRHDDAPQHGAGLTQRPASSAAA